MRRVLAAVLALCLLCGAALAAGILHNGSFSGSAQGRNGLIEVAVTVSDGAVEAVEVEAYAETPSKLQSAMQIVPRIIGCKSYAEIEAVDTITGATATSQGIKDAVLDAVKEDKPGWDHAEDAPCPSERFTDAPPYGDWAHQPIDWAVSTGLAYGVSDTEFAPDRRCTRAEIVTFLWRIAGAPVEYGALNIPFEDVERMQFYTQAVHWAVTNGIVKGVDETHFAPNKICSRAESVSLIWRMAGSEDLGLTKAEEPDDKIWLPSLPFKDVEQNDWFYAAVRWAVARGISYGVSDTQFAPDRSCTRAEIVALLFRVSDKE